MKGFEIILAVVFAGQAFAAPSYSQQDKRAEGGDDLVTEEDLYGTFIKACPSLGIPQYYCANNVAEQCVGIFNNALVRVQKKEMVKDDQEKFEADVKACAKPRDPATDAGLCYDQKLSGEACSKYAKEFREKNKFLLGINEGEKPQEPSKPKVINAEEQKTMNEECSTRGLTKENCIKAQAQCSWACALTDQVHNDCPREDKQTEATLDDFNKCVQNVALET